MPWLRDFLGVVWQKIRAPALGVTDANRSRDDVVARRWKDRIKDVGCVLRMLR
ncbi:MAG: hypothetical protein ACE5NA_06950 [Nitrospiraceae bacterium]